MLSVKDVKRSDPSLHNLDDLNKVNSLKLWKVPSKTTEDIIKLLSQGEQGLVTMSKLNFMHKIGGGPLKTHNSCCAAKLFLQPTDSNSLMDPRVSKVTKYLRSNLGKCCSRHLDRVLKTSQIFHPVLPSYSFNIELEQADTEYVHIYIYMIQSDKVELIPNTGWFRKLSCSGSHVLMCYVLLFLFTCVLFVNESLCIKPVFLSLPRSSAHLFSSLCHF